MPLAAQASVMAPTPGCTRTFHRAARACTVNLLVQVLSLGKHVPTTNTNAPFMKA